MANSSERCSSVSSARPVPTESTALLQGTLSKSQARKDFWLPWLKHWVGKTIAFLVLLVFLLTLYYCILLRFSTGDPPRRKAPVSSDFDPDFSVGFDLTPSYGTVVVRYRNGTVVNVAKVDASTEHLKMMQRLSLPSSKHLAPPYRQFGQSWADAPRQGRRSLRRHFGWPASHDAGIVSKLTAQLKVETERYLTKSIQSVVVAYPKLVALYSEEIYDGLDYSGLQALEDFNYDGDTLHHQPHELEGAYAGSGFGLCPHYLNYTVCKEELRGIDEHTLVISFSKAAFSASYESLNSANNPRLEELDFGNMIDWHAGLSSLSGFEDPATYWERVRELIYSLPNYSMRRPLLSLVILIGDSVRNPNFLRAVKTALHDRLGELPHISYYEPLFVVAQGAAEFAWRVQENVLAHE